MSSVNTKISPHLLPHSGDMVLMECVLHYNATDIQARSKPLSVTNPLANDGQMPSLHIVEYAAQTAAIHQGLLRQAEAGNAVAGVIASVRNVEFTCSSLPLNAPLVIKATCRAQSSAGCSYKFEATSDAKTMGCGELVIAYPNLASQGNS